MVRVYEGVQGLPELVRAIEEYQGEHADVVNAALGDPLRQSVSEFSKFEGLVEASIDLDGTESHTYLIKATYVSNVHPPSSPGAAVFFG